MPVEGSDRRHPPAGRANPRHVAVLVGQTTGDARAAPRRRAVGARAFVRENGRAVAINALTETDTPHMVVAQIGFRAKPHKRPEILSAIDEMIDRMRTSSGCGRSRLVVDCEDPNAFTVLSEWQSTDAANAFLESRGFQLLRGIRMLLRGEPLVVLDEVQQRVTRLLH